MFRWSSFVAAVIAVSIVRYAPGDVLYQHAEYSPAGLASSSWWEPDDSDWDNYAWDAFTLSAGGTVNEVRWRGGYQYGSTYGKVTGFVIGFWPSNPCCNEPDLFAEPVEYSVRGLAGETPVGTINGIAMYEYALTINPGFVAEPGVKYWIQIEGSKTNVPDWGLAFGTGGDESHFRFVRGLHMYLNYPHDAMFTLLGDSACSGAVVTGHPSPAQTCAAGSASFQAAATGSGTVGFQWERETAPGSGVFTPLVDGPTGSWDGAAPGVGGIVSGATSDTMTIEADIVNGRRLSAAHAAQYRCTVANDCGTESSNGAQLTICAADLNCDGVRNGIDVGLFLQAYGTQDPSADMNGDGNINGIDVGLFLQAYGQGC